MPGGRRGGRRHSPAQYGGGGSGGLAAPDSVAGLSAWFKADALALTDNNPVTTWTDSSGNGNDVAQAVAGAKPTYKTGVLNGKPVVRFDGGDTLTKVVALNQPNTVFVVGKCNAAGAGNQMFSDGLDVGSKENAVYFNAAGQFSMYAGAGGSGVGDSTGAFGIFTGKFNGASSIGYINGAIAIATHDVGAQNPTQISIGSNGTASFLTGDIAEVLWYNAAVTSANINVVGRSLAQKYQFSWTTVS